MLSSALFADALGRDVGRRRTLARRSAARKYVKVFPQVVRHPPARPRRRVAIGNGRAR